MNSYNDNYIIRLCREDDIEKVSKLQKEWCDEDITFGFVPGDREYLLSKLGEYFFVAEVNGNIIGFVYGSVQEAANMSIFTDGTRYIEIDDIYVNSEQRNSGIGSALLGAILGAARKNGIERSLVYSSSKDSENIISFYKKHGYKTWYVQMFK